MQGLWGLLLGGACVTPALASERSSPAGQEFHTQEGLRLSWACPLVLSLLGKAGGKSLSPREMGN